MENQQPGGGEAPGPAASLGGVSRGSSGAFPSCVQVCWDHHTTVLVLPEGEAAAELLDEAGTGRIAG